MNPNIHNSTLPLSVSSLYLLLLLRTFHIGNHINLSSALPSSFSSPCSSSPPWSLYFTWLVLLFHTCLFSLLIFIFFGFFLSYFPVFSFHLIRDLFSFSPHPGSFHFLFHRLFVIFSFVSPLLILSKKFPSSFYFPWSPELLFSWIPSP